MATSGKLAIAYISYLLIGVLFPVMDISLNSMLPVMTTDMDQASRTQCLDIRTMTWSKEIGDIIGVDLEQVMPELKAVDDIIGTVTREAARETGLPKGVPVIAGCSDALASMYAMGLKQLGDAGESSGTTSLVFAGSEKKEPLQCSGSHKTLYHSGNALDFRCAYTVYRGIHQVVYR